MPFDGFRRHAEKCSDRNPVDIGGVREVKHLDVRPELLIGVHAVDEDIFCLNISMYDVGIMKCFKSTQELPDDEYDLVHGEA